MNSITKLISFFFCFSVLMKAQTLSGDYQGFLYQNYYVGKYENGKYVLVDSLQLDAKGTFIKQLDSKIYTPNTLYVIASEAEYKISKNIGNPHPHNSIRFIYMGEDVSYSTSWRQETGYLNFLKGGEPSNHIHDLNIRLEKIQTLLTQMEQLLELVEPTDQFYNQIMNSYIEKASNFNAYCQSIAANYTTNSYLNIYALMFQQVVPEKGMNFKNFKTYRAKNLFMFTDLKNPLVANVPMLPTMYRSYLYHNQPNGMVDANLIQKMQDDAKINIQKNAVPEVLAALNMHDFRPQVEILREKLTKNLDFDSIYLNNETWFAEINEILGAYEKAAPFHLMFGKDVITALERTQKPEAYTKLVEAAISITEQFSWGKAQTEIVDYLTERLDERLLKGSGKVTQIYNLKKIQIGKLAPNLIFKKKAKANSNNAKIITLSSKKFTAKGFKKTVLVFYRSGCGPCKDLIEQLPTHYQILKSKKYRVITISADESEGEFKLSSKNFPWSDKYCDYEGTAGINFKNYAILGTPTIYIIDKYGKIETKLAGMEELLNVIN